MKLDKYRPITIDLDFWFRL